MTVKTDLSPVRRFRFTELEWKLILEAVSHYADYLAQVEYEKLQEPKKKEWNRCFAIDPYQHDKELWKTWIELTNKEQAIKTKVAQLNLIERQLMLAFKLIDRRVPKWQFTINRVMH
jgi:hypothetical protein